MQKQRRILTGIVLIAIFLSSCASPSADTEYTIDASSLMLEIGATEKEVRFSFIPPKDADTLYVWLSKTSDMVGRAHPDNCEKIELIKNENDLFTALYSQLEPDTSYTYKIADISEEKHSESFTFKTVPANDYTFLFAGDPQLTEENLKADTDKFSSIVSSASKKLSPAFMIVAGDIGDTPAQAEYDAFRTVNSLKTLPTAVVRGNHDSYGRIFEKQYIFPNAEKNNYWYTYGDTLFVSLDSNSSDFETQEELLKKAVSQSDKKWFIVTMHHPVFSGCAKAGKNRVLQNGDKYAELFSQYDVDLVLAGHDHIWCRTYFMDGKIPSGISSDTKQPGQCIYVTANSSSGSKYYDIRASKPGYAAFLSQNDLPGISAVNVSADSLSVTFYEGDKLDAIETFTIEK